MRKIFFIIFFISLLIPYPAKAINLTVIENNLEDKRLDLLSRIDDNLTMLELNYQNELIEYHDYIKSLSNEEIDLYIKSKIEVVKQDIDIYAEYVKVYIDKKYNKGNPILRLLYRLKIENDVNNTRDNLKSQLDLMIKEDYYE